jgi:hypothetical protein
MAHQVSLIRACLDALESATGADIPLAMNAEAVITNALQLLSAASRHDAYLLVETVDGGAS